MKYGNVQIKPVDIDQNLAALSDLLKKGEVTQEEFKQRRSFLIKERLKFIVYTNGGYPLSKKKQALLNQILSITELRKLNEAHRPIMDRERFIQDMINKQNPPPIDPPEG